MKFDNSVASPAGNVRTVRMVITDGDGGTSVEHSKQITVVVPAPAAAPRTSLASGTGTGTLWTAPDAQQRTFTL